MPRQTVSHSCLEAIRSANPGLSEVLNLRPKEELHFVHEELKATRRARLRPEYLASVLYNGLVSKAIEPEEIRAFLPRLREILEAAKSEHAADTANALNYGFNNKTIKGPLLTTLAPLLRETGQAGINPYNLIYTFSDFEKTPLRDSRQLAQILPTLIQTARARHDPGPLAVTLGNALLYQGISSREELQAILKHASLAWKGARKWAPHELVRHALRANLAIDNLAETLRLQRHIIERGIFPTEKLTLKLWRTK